MVLEAQHTTDFLLRLQHDQELRSNVRGVLVQAGGAI